MLLSIISDRELRNHMKRAKAVACCCCLQTFPTDDFRGPRTSAVPDWQQTSASVADLCPAIRCLIHMHNVKVRSGHPVTMFALTWVSPTSKEGAARGPFALGTPASRGSQALRDAR